MSMQSQTSEASALLAQLVAIDSVNPDLVPDGAGEGEIARFVANWLEQAGVEVELDEAAPGRTNVIGIVRGSGGGRSLMLNAHMDTVGVTGMEHPHTPVVKDGRMYGRGAFDMKGGLAAIMLAAAAAKQHNLRGDVILTAVVDEEFASIGTNSVLKRWHADAAIVTEPTGLQLCVAHKGFSWLEVETIGTAAHGSLPEEGVDAIVKMGKVLCKLEELDRSLRSKPSHRLLKSGSLHASLITGGQELSSYPARCLLQIERRTIPGETPERVEIEIRQILEQIKATDPNFKATLKTTLTQAPFEVSTDEAIVQIVNRQAKTVLGGEAPIASSAVWMKAALDGDMAVASSSAWMDAALLSEAGIPTVVFGPDGTGAHAVVEWADLGTVEKCARVLIATIDEFCA
ncbi:MAG TPA: ArgE/DapE family deacylase [Ktedonobacteraceae bacterium]|nr:ArgE/DapE family deacylase [Ktedonobacteraceae bacterium]